MIAAWYAIVSLILIIYVVLDGRNFGVGMLHWFVAKTPEERRQVIAAIGPLWSWHEVWLVSFGGTMIAAFPRLIASAFAGYYLALFLILWCLILRGISIEIGGHVDDQLWQGFWDVVFVVSNCLLAVLFGAAAGNVGRGVPVDADGNFSMAFFTNFRVRGYVGLLDWYTLTISAFTVVILAAHGATYLALKTDGAVHDRSAQAAKYLWPTSIMLLIAVSVESWIVRPDVPQHAVHNPVCWLGLLILVGAVAALSSGLRSGREELALVGSSALIAGLLITGGAAIFPVMLYSTISPGNSLTAYNSASPYSSLLLASRWWPVSFVLTATYFVFISRRHAGKVSIKSDTRGF